MQQGQRLAANGWELLDAPSFIERSKTWQGHSPWPAAACCWKWPGVLSPPLLGAAFPQQRIFLLLGSQQLQLVSAHGTTGRATTWADMRHQSSQCVLY